MLRKDLGCGQHYNSVYSQEVLRDVNLSNMQVAGFQCLFSFGRKGTSWRRVAEDRDTKQNNMVRLDKSFRPDFCTHLGTSHSACRQRYTAMRVMSLASRRTSFGNYVRRLATDAGPILRTLSTVSKFQQPSKKPHRITLQQQIPSD